MSRTLALLLFGGLVAAPASAQPGFEAQYGRWWHDTHATTFLAGLYGPLLGPVSWSLGVSHLDDHLSLTDDRTQTGAVIGLGLFRDGRGVYAAGSAGLALRHGSSDVDAQWSAGLGYALTLFGGPAIALEARYRWEDAGLAGFWRLDPADRQGWGLEARLSFPIAGRGRPSPGSPGTPTPPRPPSSSDVDRFVRDGGARGNAAEITRGVVRTAIDVMGTPYQWGGTDDNGFDCSGLIQYAYGEHGIILPRVSRDQMRQGVAVETRVGDLRPGDLLGFSVEGRGISHIGLYIGDGQFIHSASRGVVTTSLTAQDANSVWWQRRWVAARRIVE